MTLPVWPRTYSYNLCLFTFDVALLADVLLGLLNGFDHEPLVGRAVRVG